MRILSMILLWTGGFFIGIAVPDIKPKPEPELPRYCDPAKTQVLRMDNSEQITQVLDRGVNCVVVMRGLQ